MPDIETLDVRGRAWFGYADTPDAGTLADLAALIGTVEFVPNLKPSDGPLVHLPTGDIVVPVKVIAPIRADGRIVPPANGYDGAPATVDLQTEDPVVRLIAPNQEFNITDWTWTATFKGKQGGPVIPQIVRHFTGGPDAQIVLGRATGLTSSGGMVAVKNYPVTTTAEPWPVGYRHGTDTLSTPDGTIYLWKDGA
jgi:hypothetical protein